MKNLLRQSLPPEVKIEEIITYFGQYAIGDIKYNIENKDNSKPIPAFIICCCLIDHLAASAPVEETKNTSKAGSL